MRVLSELGGRAVMAIIAVFLAATAGLGQAKPVVAGDYAGVLGPLHLKLHLTRDAQGSLGGTLDSPDQGATGIACADFLLDGENLSFTVPAVHGSWKGTLATDGSLSGTWDQGSPLPLKFLREAAFAPAGKASPIDGIWLGTLTVGGSSLRIQMTFKSDRQGHEFGTGDSLDQGATGLECSHIVFSAGSLSFEVPVVNGSWSGKLSEDGKTLIGSWKQGEAIPLNFTRQATAATVKPVGPPSFDAAMEKVKVEDLQSVLDADLAEVLRTGELASGTGVGVSIAVVQHGVRKVFTYGDAKPDSIFEIGSITKTFTGLILAQLVEEKKVKLDEPVRALLPTGTVPAAITKPEAKSGAKADAEITLLDLATQHSGLPRMPDNFRPADETNPYADYRAADLYAFLSKNGLQKPKDAGFLYSNLGFGLLGQALANRSAIAYPEVLRDQVTGPLGLNDTLIELSADQRARFLPGHDEGLHPAHAWDLVALAGAGAIRSTAGDMLTYLEAQLRPENVKPAKGFGGSQTLVKALEESHELRAGAMSGPRMNSSIALAWLYDVDSGTYWHNGETGGYSAYAFFNPLHDWAGVVLVNASVSSTLTDKLGEHIRARLTGDRAISLGK